MCISKQWGQPRLLCRKGEKNDNLRMRERGETKVGEEGWKVSVLSKFFRPASSQNGASMIRRLRSKIGVSVLAI